MRLAFLVAVSLLATSCFFSEDGALTATWRVMEGGVESTCENVGGVTVRVVSKHDASGHEDEDLFDCVDYGGRTASLRPGNYTLFIELLDAEDRPITQPFSAPAHVDGGEEQAAGHFLFEFPAGSMSATWRISVNGAAANCSDAGGTTVEIVSTPEAGPGGAIEPYRDVFHCDAGAGTTELLPGGVYAVRIRLLDAAENEISYANVDRFEIADRETRALGHIEFPFTFRTASFQVRMGDEYGDNCERIDEQEIRVADPALRQCLSYPLGGDAAGVFACQRSACQAQSKTQQLRNLGNGTYTLQVLGYQKAAGDKVALCYFSDPVTFTVADGDVSLGLVIAPYDDSQDPEHLCQP